MFAIVNISGRQYKITEHQKLCVPKLTGEPGSKITLGDVILYSKDGKAVEPVPSKINIQATILNHLKDDKVMVFKKKRRKGYKRTRGHRQAYTEIEITKIEAKGKKIKAAE